MAKNKNKTEYRIIIKKEKDYFKLGNIVIFRYKGDILYAPSEKTMVGGAGFNSFPAEIEHIAYHQSGRVHIKFKNNKYAVLEYGDTKGKIGRQKIKETGFQHFLMERIIDFTKLPKNEKKLKKLDVVLDSKNYQGFVRFDFSMISGRLIVAHFSGDRTNINPVMTEKKNSLILDISQRCLGCESNNADKLLQYVLKKSNAQKEQPTNRTIFIPRDYGIEREI